jgi:hypothetical protein
MLSAGISSTALVDLGPHPPTVQRVHDHDGNDRLPSVEILAQEQLSVMAGMRRWSRP